MRFEAHIHRAVLLNSPIFNYFASKKLQYTCMLTVPGKYEKITGYKELECDSSIFYN
jgi:hypothetical protein